MNRRILACVFLPLALASAGAIRGDAADVVEIRLRGRYFMEPAGSATRMTVRDTGPGIAPEDLPLIFERFYKADAARASGGSGLGLSIVKAIVEHHGGSITAYNDNGAVLEIMLPASR